MNTQIKQGLAAALLCIMCAGIFSGCGMRQEIDASAYVKAWLDCAFKNDTTAAQGENNAIYEEEINDITDSFLAAYRSEYEVTEEIEADFRELFKELLAKAKYTVGDARLREDGSYVVTVMCEQMQLRDSFETEYNRALIELYKKWKQFPASAPASQEDADKYVMGLLRDGMRNGLADVTYGEPVEIQITLEPDGRRYQPRESDVYRLTMELFDIFNLSM